MSSRDVEDVAIEEGETPLIRLPPPFIYTPSLANLRDVGGLLVSSGDDLAVKRGILYRGADPSFVTEEELAFLNGELGITHIYDLRSEPEFERQGDALIDWEARIRKFNEGGGGKIQRHWTPVFKTEDYSPESIALRFRDYGSTDSSSGFTRAYTEILLHGGPSYNMILKHLSSPSPTGILIHCTAGKDRTGVLIALILRLLGVQVETVCKEYELTEVGLSSKKKGFVERIMSSGAFEGEEGRRAAERMTSARAESMRATLAMVDEKWGGVEGYVKEICGADDAMLAGLRGNLIVSVEELEGGAGVSVL
ncbi:hypothetical protein E6O75_ATG01533 [Venturia nashicola]|uniref:Tyrosine specific protein phosphatases domain-containing protein n=1 Tax=Venturia nashicola TaxID=86259 RepID=A0A4Z1PE37_9PEZI|nr:hypothetical protein E6O75_ATG01533 [Venturia nashicola]